MKKVDIDDLYYGIMLNPMSYSSYDERKTLRCYNLFGFGRVKWSVARYVTMTDKERKELLTDPLRFCFGDVWSRTEFEFIVCPWPYKEDEEISDGVKVDAWTMYVEPNAKLLMEMVDSVSKESASRYLKEMKKLYKS